MTVSGTVEHVYEYTSGLVADINVDSQFKNDSAISAIRPFLVRITVPTISHLPKPGETVFFTGVFNTVKARQGIPDEIDFTQSLLIKGISSTAFVKENDFHITGRNQSLFWKIRYLKDRVNYFIYTSGVDAATSDFLSATLTGDSSALGHESRTLFSAAGLAHILALSGAHVMILAAVLAIGLFPLTLFQFNRLRIICTIIALWTFAVMTGLSPSVTRAVIMTTTVSCAYLLGRRNVSMNALMAAAMLIILFDPQSLFLPGFQLSFAAVAAIILLYQRINPFNHHRLFIRTAASIFLLPCVAMLATAPISIYYFHYFPLAFLIVSVPATYLLTIVIGGGVVLVILTALSVPHSFLCSVMDQMYDLANKMMEWAGSISGSVIDNIYIDGVTTMLLLLIPVSIAALVHYRNLSWAVATVLIAMASTASFVLSRPVYSDHELFITTESDVTNFLIKEHSNLFFITNAPETRVGYMIENYSFRYKDYMGRRKIDSLTHISGLTESENIYFDGRRLWWRGALFAIIDSDSDLRPMIPRPDYAVVCRGFRLDICDVDSIINPTEILLSNDLNLTRHDSYVSELEEKGIRYTSLRKTGLFHLTDK